MKGFVIGAITTIIIGVFIFLEVKFKIIEKITAFVNKIRGK